MWDSTRSSGKPPSGQKCRNKCVARRHGEDSVLRFRHSENSSLHSPRLGSLPIKGTATLDLMAKAVRNDRTETHFPRDETGTPGASKEVLDLAESGSFTQRDWTRATFLRLPTRPRCGRGLLENLLPSRPTDVVVVLEVMGQFMHCDGVKSCFLKILHRHLLAPHGAEAIATLRQRHRHAVHARNRVK